MTTACDTCDYRDRCMTSGWLSPNRMWFPNVVVLCPVEGCRRFVEGLDRLRRRMVADETGIVRDVEAPRSAAANDQDKGRDPTR